MDEQLVALYHRHVAAAFDRRLRLAAFAALKVGKAKWGYARETAALTYGKLTFEAPLLGAPTHGDTSWLWAWSDKHVKLTLTNRALGDLVRVTAHRLGVPTLAHPAFALEPLLGPELAPHGADVLGTVLGRELGYDAHHIIAADGHAAVVLVRDDRLKFAERYPLHRVLTVFPKVVAALPVLDHRAALADYARDYGLTATAVPGALTVSDGKGTLTAAFDEHDRLIKIDGANVAAPPVKKPAAKVVAKPPAKKPTAKKVVKGAKKPAPKAKPAVKKVVAKKPARPAPKAKPARKR